MGSNPLIDQYLKNLAAVQAYRIANTNAGRIGVGAGAPTALQLAMQAMRDRAPIGTYTPPPSDEGFTHGHAWWNPVGWAKGVLDSGPVKWTIDKLERPFYGVSSVYEGNQTLGDSLRFYLNPTKVGASNSPAKGTGNAAKDFWQGFSGKNPVTLGDVLNYDKPEGFGQGTLQFTNKLMLDLVGDPVSYINPAKPIVAAKNAIRGTKATEQASKEVLTADKIIQGMPETKQPLAIAGHSVSTPRFTAGASGVVDRFNPIQLADELTASNLAKAVGETPKLAHPNLEVAPFFKTVTEKTTSKVPKTITETVEVPADLASKPTVSKSLAQRRAIKMAMLQSPKYKVAGQFTIEDLLKVAAEHPDRQADIEKLINNEVNSVFKAGKASEVIPASKSGQRLIGLTGRSGTGNAAFGLTLEQATQLFKEGRIGGVVKNYEAEGVQDFLAKLPFHDPSDFEAVTLKNAKGATVSLKQYLDELGVDVSAVTPGGKSKSILYHGGEDSVFDFMKKPQTVKKTVTKTVYEEVKSTTTKHVRPSQAEAVAWALQHQGKLSNKEIAYLRGAASHEQFLQRVKELSTKQMAGDFKTLQDVVAAYKAGLIPKEAFQKLLDIAGAKGPDDLLKKANKIMTGLKGAPKSTVKPKVERIKGRAPDTIWEGVKPVDAIIDDVSNGDLSLVQTAAPTVSQQLVSDLSTAIPEGVRKNLARVLDPQGEYRWETTIKRAKRTSPVAGQGVARNLHGWNMYSQSDVFRALVGQASGRLYNLAKGKQGAEFYAALRLRPAMMYTQVMGAMRAAEYALKKQGVKLVAGSDNQGLLLSMVDVLDSLDPKFVQKYLFSAADKVAPNIHPTKFMSAAEAYAQAAINGGSLDLARENAVSIFSDIKAGERLGRTGSVDDIVKNIEQSMPTIMQRVTANYAEESIKLGESVKSMTDGVIGNLLTKYADPTVSVGNAFEELVNAMPNMSATGRAIGAPAEALQASKVVLASELATKGISSGDMAEATLAGRMSRTANAKEAAKVGAAQQKSRVAEAGHLAQPDDVVELSDVFDIALNAGVFRANAPILGKVVAIKDMLGRAFYASYGHEDLHYLVHQNRNVVTEFSRMHRQMMINTYDIAHASYGAQASDKLKEAFKVLQTGAKVEDPAMVPLVESMGNSIGVLFGGGNASFSVRNGLFASNLNRVLDYFAVNGKYRFKDGVPLAKQTEVWKAWDEVSDPLDLLDKVHAAYQRATVEATIGRDISSRWGKSTKAEGFVKVTDTRGVSKVFGFLDKDLYFPKEIVEQLPHLDRALDETLYKSSSQLIRLYDSVLHAYKAGLTIYRPGHHVRNLIGDIGLSFLAGVTSPTRYYDAIRILKGRASTYSGEWDAFKALQTGAEYSGAKLGVENTVRIAGKNVKVTDDAVWRAAFNQGLLNDYQVMEDIAFSEAQKFGRTSSKWHPVKAPLAGKLNKAAGGLSQSRDHMVRLAHFVDVLKKGNFKTIEDAFDEAGKVVRKWHPDGSDLTKFERSTMRRVIPFYSWFRKAIPLVVEAMVTKPGRALVVPKAMYEFAKTMGVDPDSLGNPFPQDQLFPSWLSDNILGPQWTGSISLGPVTLGADNGQLYGMNPGDPVSDLGSSYLGADAGKQILGSVTPVARMPVELMSGTSLGTGSPINSRSEYLTQNMPGISVVGAITGKDVLGGWENKTAVQKGYQPEGLDPVALQNFLLGLGVKSYNKPNYVKSAQFELRDKLRDQAGK